MSGYRQGTRYCRRCGQPRVHDTSPCAYCNEPALAPSHEDDTVRRALYDILGAIALCVTLVAFTVAPYLLPRDLRELAHPWVPWATLALVAGFALARGRRLGPELTALGSARSWVMAAGLTLLFAVASYGLWQPGPEDDMVPVAKIYGDLPRSVLGLTALLLAEELALRGLVFGALRPHMSRSGVYAIATLTFALARIAWPDWILAVPLGLALASLRERSGTPYPGIALRLGMLAALFA